MKTNYFVAQDQNGERRTVQVLHANPEAESGGTAPATGYALEDGSPVRRVDSDTFQIVGTGAYITLVRE